jgi:hypothetical protein
MDDCWVAWEPPEWVAARGPSLCLESEHFCVRWGAGGSGSGQAAQSAPTLLHRLEECFARFCVPTSESFFVVPYTASSWSDDGLRRKLNVYIGTTGLDPYPQQGSAYAHQGTYVESPVEAVRHARANPQAKLHHSYLALHPSAASAHRTCCHELAHVLQMHTGGHLDTEYVGYQWEAHAEYCVHLHRPLEWAPHVPVFLRTCHLPIDCTRYDGEGEGSGRQYIVWPFYCFLDKRLGERTTHLLWHADREQRQQSGRSRDMLSALFDLLRQGGPATGGPASGATISFGALFGAFAMASLTMDWGWMPGQSAALLASADPLDELRFTPLRAARRAGEPDPCWQPDGSRPLKRCGFAAHRLRIDGEDEVRIVLRGSAGAGGHDLWLGVVGLHPSTGARHYPVSEPLAVRAADSGDGSGGSGTAVAAIQFVPLPGHEYLVSVCASPGAQDGEEAAYAPLAWGTDPSTLPTAQYTLQLQGCRPHAAAAATHPTAGGPLAVLPSASTVRVPTGLRRMRPVPKLSGGGASLTALDIRSGNPGEVNTVELVGGTLRARGRTVHGVSFSYRCVVGYSTDGASPGPYFELQLLDRAGIECGGGIPRPRAEGHEADAKDCACWHHRWGSAAGGSAGACEECADVDAAASTPRPPPPPQIVHVLYRSAEMPARPYSWDTATGGNPTNYCPPVRIVDKAPCVVEGGGGETTGGALRLQGDEQILRLVFFNGRRNMHLQGGGWVQGMPPEGCANLELELRLDERNE